MYTLMRILGTVTGLTVSGGLGFALVGLALATSKVAALFIVAGIAILPFSLSYLIATKNRQSNAGEYFKGVMTGLNGGLNAVLLISLFMPEPHRNLSTFFKAFGSWAGGPGIVALIGGAYFALLSLLSGFHFLTGSVPFQAILAYSSWLMPMSWLVTVVGFLFFLINLILAGVTANRVDVFKIRSVGFHGSTCSILTEGGLIHPLGGSSGFDMGTFVFLNSTGESLKAHETGHTLNLAAFGFVFHYIGALDENVFGGHGNAYSERLADSHIPGNTSSAEPLNMWQPA
jgi:hypothetical protein